MFVSVPPVLIPRMPPVLSTFRSPEFVNKPPLLIFSAPAVTLHVNIAALVAVAVVTVTPAAGQVICCA